MVVEGGSGESDDARRLVGMGIEILGSRAS